MKLEKYEDKSKKKRKIILISISVIVLLSISFLLYKTFAIFNEHVEFPMMNGKVDYFGNSDVYFVFYKGDELLEEMPQKDNSENLVFSHGECDNAASIEWNESEWAPLVKGLNSPKTKCSLYFEEYVPTFDKEVVKCGQGGTGAAECIKNNANLDTVNLMADDTSDANIRYVGANETVNNYIDIGDKDSNGNPILWRIIGVMNNITNLDNGGQEESLVKIIRAESIGNYSWDSSAEGINNGNGVNEWSQADVMKLLNPNTVYSGTPTIGGSLYWNRGSGSCYIGSKEANTTCNFTSSGISEEAKNKIAKVRWNTGTFATYSTSDWTAKATYEAERGSHNGKEQCASNGGGNNCNDTVPRTTTWEGYIGLMYPSDYGYAVGGSVRETCLGKSMNKYNSDSCNTNDWLKPSSGYSWTITPSPYSSHADRVFSVYSSGYVRVNFAYIAGGVQPVVYLSSSVKIIDGNGEKGTPFIAQLDN